MPFFGVFLADVPRPYRFSGPFGWIKRLDSAKFLCLAVVMSLKESREFELAGLRTQSARV
jgi:hypothetical protein